MSRSSSAYDLRRFQKKPQQYNRKPRLSVARPSTIARARARLLTAFKVCAALAVLTLVVVTMLYSRAMLTELNQQVSSAYSKLAEEKSEGIRLQTELESIISLRNVEEYATQRLGMSTMDKSQITFLDMSEGDQFEISDKSPRQTLMDRVRVVLSDLQEYHSKE